MAAPKWAKTGERRFDISRLTESWALMYNCPHKPPTTSTAIPGRTKTGTKNMTAANLIINARVKSVYWRYIQLGFMENFYGLISTHHVAETLSDWAVHSADVLGTPRYNAGSRDRVQPSVRPISLTDN
jgi:hypothetical protein